VIWRGVEPFFVSCITSPPASNNNLRISIIPCCAAKWSGAQPLSYTFT
jgi:hypothetical protein